MVKESRFIEKTQPTNILDVMKEGLLKPLLNSYCYPLSRGLGVHYPTVLPVNIEKIGRIEASGIREREFFSRFCREYRSACGACEKACKNSNDRIMEMYYKGELEGPKLFLCHLGLWDVAYPLYAGGRLVGVLFAGQDIVKEEVLDWFGALESIKNEVLWYRSGEQEGGGIVNVSNHVEYICKAIDGHDKLDTEQKNRFKELIQKEGKERGESVTDLLGRYEEFKQFGKTLEKLVDDLYEARVEAAMRGHIGMATEVLMRAGEELSENADEFWSELDNVIGKTLPDASGYVLYMWDEHGKKINPVRTCGFEKVKNVHLEHEALRKLCNQVLKKFQQGGRDHIRYDVMVGSAPGEITKLFNKAVQYSGKSLWNGCVIGVPLLGNKGRLMGGLVCVTAGGETDKGIYIKKRRLAYLARGHTTALRSIGTVLSMVLARHTAEEAQAYAWVERSHELIAPIHAVKGYHDNLKYVFGRYIRPMLEGGDGEIEKIFWSRLDRLAELCDLQELIATSGAVEKEIEKEEFELVDFDRVILLPIVQSLRDFGATEKGVSVYYDNTVLEMPTIYLYVDGMKRCLFNLIFNAIKYSYRETTVNVSLKVMHHHYEVHISNKGIGVPAGEEHLIFERFKQGSNAKKAAAYGVGLGLNVARRIAILHEGDVKLVSRGGGGDKTVFALVLPKSAEYGPPSTIS